MNTVHNECQSPRTHYSVSHSAGSRTHDNTRRCVAGANTPVSRSLSQNEDTQEDNLEDSLEKALQDNLGDVLQHTLMDAVEMFRLEVEKALLVAQHIWTCYILFISRPIKSSNIYQLDFSQEESKKTLLLRAVRPTEAETGSSRVKQADC